MSLLLPVSQFDLYVIVSAAFFSALNEQLQSLSCVNSIMHSVIIELTTN